MYHEESARSMATEKSTTKNGQRVGKSEGGGRMRNMRDPRSPRMKVRSRSIT